MTDYVLDYANKVLSGEIPAASKIKQACQRELKDRKRVINDASFNYHFDNDMANKAINFMELIPDPTGENTHLASFQKWIIGSLAGWRTNGTDYRRFREAFISMARKNGKSALASQLGISTLLLENQPARGRQILFVANTLKQAMLTFGMARNELNQSMIKSPSLRQRLAIRKQQIDDKSTDSYMTPLPSDPDHLDGYNPALAIVDEAHEYNDSSIVDVLKSGMGQQKNSLICLISTTGNKLHGYFHGEYERMTDILLEKKSSDRQFIAIYEQDSDKDIYDSNTWQHSNPLLEIDSVARVVKPNLQNDVDNALQTGDLNPVLIKNFNMWREQSNESYISVHDWNNYAVEPLNVSSKDVYIGVDLSKTNDLTSVSWLVPMDHGKYYADSHSFVASRDLEKKIRHDGIDYSALERRSEVNISRLEAGVIDYDEIFSYVMNLIQTNNWNVKALAYDPFMFGYLLPRFEREGLPLVQVRQGARTLSQPIKTFKEALLKGEIIHDKNQLLKIAIDNSIVKYDNGGNVLLDKQRYENKIDPLAALMNAWTLVYGDKLNELNDKSDYYTNQFSF